MTDQSQQPAVLETLSRSELIEVAGQWLEKAQAKHREARLYRNECEKLRAEVKALRGRTSNG